MTKQGPHQNPVGPCCTLQSGPFFQDSAQSVVALLVFHNLPCSWVSDGHIPQMWPALPFDGMCSAWQEHFYWGQDCLQINSGFWNWAKLELYSCLAGCVPLHVDCREAISINHFSVSHPQLAGMVMGRCCRRVLMTGDLQQPGKGAKESCLLEQH